MNDPIAAVAAVTGPTTFNFAEAVSDRSYPEIDVPVYLDERAVRELIDARNKINDLETVIAGMANPGVDQAKQLLDLQDMYELQVDALKEQRYVVRLRGIAPEKELEIERASEEAFPIEYTENVSPITGGLIRTPVESDARDEHIAMRIRQAYFVSITNPSGAVDTDFADLEKVRTIFRRLPLVARAKVDEAIEACTINVDYYRELVDEVF